MPFNVDQLISEQQKLVAIRREAKVREAVELMIEHDYSQLPVVDSDGKLLGMITGDSVIRALNNFNTNVDGLRVEHAMIPAKKHFLDDDLFELLNDLRDESALAIVDGEEKAIGVVTSFDTTEYFRRRAQDMMYVEDIESALKEYISSAFTNDNEELDDAARSEAVMHSIASDNEARKQFNRAVVHYLNISGVGADKFDVANATATFDASFPRQEQKSFDDLTLAEFNQMLVHSTTWRKIGNVFNLDKKAVSDLLDEVRKTRNALFHFRGEISQIQRAQLQFCAEWLNRQRPTPATDRKSDAYCENVSSSVDFATESSRNYTATVMDINSTGIRAIVPVEEVVSSDSRYAPLARYLQGLHDSISTEVLSFEEVEGILGDRLPANARQHRAWWANDSVSHVQSQQWLDAGWRVNGISIADQRVKFARNVERERKYINFFSAAIADLDASKGITVKATSPGGQSWQTVAVLPKVGPQLAVFSMAFTFRSRFRVELYIDTWNKDQNKRVFDALFANRTDIENSVGAPLSWERLDAKRACRVALYHEGSITGATKQLDELRNWSKDAMTRLFQGIADRADFALTEISKTNETVTLKNQDELAK